MYRIIISIIAVLILTGCSIGEKQLKIFKLEEPRQKLELQKPTMPELEKTLISPIFFEVLLLVLLVYLFFLLVWETFPLTFLL